MNPLLVITCAASLNGCHLPNAPEGLYAGKPVVINLASKSVCEAQSARADASNAAKHLTKAPVHTVCVEIAVDTEGGWDVADADGGASLWVPVIATSDANASAADGPPAGMVAAVAFTNNARCLANLPKVESGKSYPVCAKVEVRGTT